MAAELTTIPAQSNPADYNRIVRFELTISLTGVAAQTSVLDVTSADAAANKAREIRSTLSALPTFESVSLRRVVRYVYEPYCSEKHGSVEC